MNHFVLLISLITAQLSFAAEAVVEKMKVEVTTTPSAVPAVAEAGTLTATIGDSLTFSTLKNALVASGLDVVLADKKGVYTIFAPTDEAFGKLPAGTLAKLMLPENKEKLRSLLLYHVIPGQMLAVDLKDGQVTTMNGEKVKIKVNDGKVEIDNAKVFSTDVMANNGVMHSIGNVMIPKSLEGFSGLDK